eukprot:jgi/Botrbrau1/15691/Bobra.4_1s0068.1
MDPCHAESRTFDDMQAEDCRFHCSGKWSIAFNRDTAVHRSLHQQVESNQQVTMITFYIQTPFLLALPPSQDHRERLPSATAK